MKKPQTRLFALLGSNIEHSLSPKIHNKAFQKKGFPANYILLNLKAREKLPALLDVLKYLDFGGLNVTMPYKELVCKYVDELVGCAKEINSVNTLQILNDKTIKGYNTDGLGFIKDAKRKKINFKNKKILLFGTGGTARAIFYELYNLKKNKPAEIFILTRNKQKINSIWEKLLTDKNISQSKIICDILEWQDEKNQLHFKEADVLINATPVGMQNIKQKKMPIKWTLVKKNAVYYDIVYSPCKTVMMKEAKKNGLTVFGGYGMLKRQAELSRNVWYKKSTH